MREGRWLSPLRAADLDAVAVASLGELGARERDAHGVTQLEIVRRVEGSEQSITLRIFEQEGLASFHARIGSPGGYMRMKGSHDHAGAEWLDATLATMEVRMLLLRAIYGEEMDAVELLRAPDAAVAARMRSLLGIASLDGFERPESEKGREPHEADEAIRAIVEEALSSSPDERAEEARAAWRVAAARSDADAMLDAALVLSHEMLFDEAVACYLETARRFSERASDCAHAIGDCRLHAVELAIAAPEDAPAFLVDALDWYDRALEAGTPRRHVDESYFSVVEVLAQRMPGSAEAREAVERYADRFPSGAYRARASRMRDESGIVRLGA